MKLNNLYIFALSLGALFFQTNSISYAGEIRDNIEDRGYLRCGYIKSSFLDQNPVETFSQDLCKALALSLFPDPKAFKLIALDKDKASQDLLAKKVDVIALANSTNLSSSPHFQGTTTLLYNSLDVMILFRGSRPSDLNGQKICSLNKTDKTSLAIFGQKNQVSFSVKSYKADRELLNAVLNHECKAVALPFAEQAILSKSIAEVFPQPTILNSSTGTALKMITLASDNELFEITKALSNRLIASEHLNITSQNIDLVASSTTDQSKIDVLDIYGENAIRLGLDKNWFYRVIKVVGNYSEIFQRSFKDHENQARGLNQPVASGGKLEVIQ